ncbi:MAG: SEC-C metal-binding domain-containing protein [Oscillospiraceae bacterium]|nr:SEC-C metal-binding domain-containing protein [Oscillospiraceae bacterium]MDD4369302.1 SEC-C metal-binding domain-containing protein [Oscillospiraceae bacterium]
MSKSKAQRIFEKYNPAAAVTRCPNGRAPFRKLLDLYAKAAVNLYGVISIKEFAEIINRQNTEKTTPHEIFTLLLPVVLKHKWYCFYKEYIVHYWAIDDFEYADFWLMEQGDKPRFIPPKDELLKFENPYYESEKQAASWQKLNAFIFEAWPDKGQIYRFYNELKEISAFSTSIQELSELFEKYGLAFSGEKQAQTFFNLLMDASNNTRMWSNKGYTPNEMSKLMAARSPQKDPSSTIVSERKKIGLNDPCPCGSGKKYKKCCRLTEEARTAQLSSSECALFYETWYGLLGYVNERKKIISASIKPVYPNPVSDEQLYKVREILWKNPGLIDDYLDAVVLPDDKAGLFKAWRHYHKKGMFFLVEYKPEYAVAIGSNEQKEDRLYGIKGISRPLSSIMRRELPIQFETVLLPFEDKLIYDSFISSIPIGFGEGAKRAFRDMYDNALGHGIITRLGDGI